MTKKEEIKENYQEQLKKAMTDLKTPGKRKKQIPNILTSLRLLSPLLIIPAAITGNTAFAAWSALGFGLTDMVDGALARKWDAKSELGADLDALSDKIFAGTLLIGGAIFNPYLIVNILLEMTIAGINLKQKFSGKPSGSTNIGKAKTWALFGLGALGIISPTLNMSPVLLPTLAAGTALMQGLTIHSYIDKYKQSNTKEDALEKEEQEVNSLLNESEEEPEVKTKYYQNANAKTNVIVKPDNLLEQLRQASAYLHEQQVQPTEEKPKTYQKTN